MRHLRLTKFPVCGGVLNTHISQRHTSYTVNPCIHMYTYPWAPLLGMMTVHHETSAGLNYMHVMEIQSTKQCHARCMHIISITGEHLLRTRTREREVVFSLVQSPSHTCAYNVHKYIRMACETSTLCTPRMQPGSVGRQKLGEE